MGAKRKIEEKLFFLGRRHDNKILNVQMLSSRKFVVIAQAPRFSTASSTAIELSTAGGHYTALGSCLCNHIAKNL